MNGTEAVSTISYETIENNGGDKSKRASRESSSALESDCWVVRVDSRPNIVSVTCSIVHRCNVV
ncbi:hypothetical protein ACHAW5_010726 [Stephanodiscus triporus]|uniref:Uncharacterized protein n=1 Tax=Stephanodiscus triporus TaxID=2934178 RepID=A0ABD3MHC3_9STRA